MRRTGRRAPLPVLSLVLLLGAATAAAQEARQIPRSTLPGLGTHDPRGVVDRHAAPWRSLGRVQTELGGRCTGALVGPALVLTAAHCLVAWRSRALVQPGSVHFLLGYDRGQAVGHARVIAFRIGAGFRPADNGPAAADWALLTLEGPITGPGSVLPLLRNGPAPRDALMLGGYQQDRPEVILADSGCHAIGITASEGGPLLMHDCAGTRGASGAPLLARGPDGGWAVAGVAARAALDVAMGVAVPAATIAAAPK